MAGHTEQTVKGDVSEASTGCNQGGKGLSFGGINIPTVTGRPGKFDGLGNACQLKAVTGGLMVGLGSGLLLVGVVVLVTAIASGTKAGKAAAGALGTAVAGPAGGKAASSVAGTATKATKAGTISAPRAQRSQNAGISALFGDATENEIEALQRSAKEQTRQRRENPSAKQKEFEANRRASKRATSSRFALQPGEQAF
jgi:hypothetical protein